MWWCWFSQPTAHLIVVRFVNERSTRRAGSGGFGHFRILQGTDPVALDQPVSNGACHRSGPKDQAEASVLAGASGAAKPVATWTFWAVAWPVVRYSRSCLKLTRSPRVEL